MKRAIIAALAVLVPAPAAAQAVKDQPVVTLDPAKAYIHYSANKFGTALRLIREPTEKDRADYAARRAEALAKAQKRFVNQLRDWESRVKARQVSSAAPAPGPKPVEPTDATFIYEPIEIGLMVGIGPFDRFSKAGDASSYLHAVEPGTYRIYGPIALVPNGDLFGTCLCMGTVQFEVAAGGVVNLGRIGLPFSDALSAPKDGSPRPKTALDLPPGISSFRIDPAAPADARITGLPVKPATYRAAGRIPNFFGVEVDRVTAMPGVIRYDERGRIFDEASGTEVK